MRVIFLTALALSLTTSPITAAEDADITFFEAKVRPLLAKHCFECHSAKSKTVQGGLRLDHLAGVTKGGDTGSAVVAGKPNESRLYVAVTFKNSDLQMPPAGKMSDAEIEILRLWIERGAVFPSSAAENATAHPARRIDIAQGKKHWSFRPFGKVDLPDAFRVDSTERRIDVFLNQKLAAQHIQPVSRADRATLIRRVSFDLIGLPPTSEDVAAFVQDDAPDAYERLVERLLASPQHGERWGRNWLDLVRYADVIESWAQSPAQAWVYRDWVVRALNEDLPYDRFVKRQFAADQDPEAQPSDIAALGFLGLSPSYWKELKLAPDVIKSVVAEEWEERVSMISGSILGLTMACARCHDHKTDPITAQDYYALAGVLASIRQAPRSLLPGPESDRVAAAKKDVANFETEAKKLREQAAKAGTASEELKQKADGLLARAEEIKRSTPHYESPLAYAIEDASLSVLPDGPNRTKLDYAVGRGQDIAMQVRGNPSNSGPSVPRRFLSVLSAGEPRPFTTGSGRRELGEAIVTESASLAARVIVNRVWRHHFGRGLVDTPSNFGVQGTPPTHPELLDDLAQRFVAADWSLKWLHREIVLSAAYQRTSRATPETLSADPNNVWLGRMSRRRLEVEAWRDSVLFVTGSLNRRIGGEPRELNDAQHDRRTLYGTIRRRELNDLLRLYDFPDPTGHSPARLETTTPLQQLFVLNSAFMQQQARALVGRLQAEAPRDLRAQLEAAHRHLHGRTPNANELARELEFLGPQPSPEQWQQLAEVLLSTNALAFVD